jgi:antirestriction protein ArdC
MPVRNAARESTDHRDPIQEFADLIIEHLEKGVKPWVRPWDPEKCAGPHAPFNPVTEANYHGVNVLILAIHPLALIHDDPRWMTYQQAIERKWQVKKGSKSTTIFFTKRYEKEEQEAEDGKRAIRFLKHYAVFHASQIEGVPDWKPPAIEETPWSKPEASAVIIANSGAVVHTGGDRAFYSPIGDFIQLPPENAFRGPPHWACVALHELGHWTGHGSRLGRDLTGSKGSARWPPSCLSGSACRKL